MKIYKTGVKYSQIHSAPQNRTVILEEGVSVDETMPGENAKVIAVTSFSGGTGVSTVAAALSKSLRIRSYETLYLNLEALGSMKDVFYGKGTGTMAEVLAEVSSVEEPSVKALEPLLSWDATGTAFIKAGSDSKAVCSASGETLIKLLTALRYDAGFSYIVADINFEMTDRYLAVLDNADRIIVINDGTSPANEKFARGMGYLRSASAEKGVDLVGRMELLYNRFSSSKSSKRLDEPGMPVLGMIPPLMHATTREIVNFMFRRMDLLRSIK